MTMPHRSRLHGATAHPPPERYEDNHAEISTVPEPVVHPAGDIDWQRQLDVVFAAATDGLVLVDTQGRLVQMSPFAATFLLGAATGAPPARSARTQARLRDPRTVEGVPMAPDEEAWPFSRLLNGTVLTGEDAPDVLVRALDGADLLLQVCGTPLRDRAGQVVGAVAIFREVTEHWQLDRETREMFQAVAGATRALQRAAEPIAGVDARSQRVGAHGQIVDHLLRVSRSVLTVQARTRGVLERWRRLQEQAHTRSEALEKANQRMEEFLGIASHELKTPLTTISVALQLLSRRLAAQRLENLEADALREQVAAARALLDNAEKSASRLRRLMNDLVDASRIKSGKLELRPEPCDLAALVQDTVREQRQLAPRRRIVLELPPNAVPVVADAERIRQVLTNYLTNALRYAPVCRPITVRLEVEPTHARVSVRDEGPGLPPDQQELVWDLFHRAPGIAVQSGSGMGLGLGLHISRTIIERHEGQVGVQSAPGEGATFWFTLPRAQ
jgi:signal transduction histidine kinase